MGENAFRPFSPCSPPNRLDISETFPTIEEVERADREQIARWHHFLRNANEPHYEVIEGIADRFLKISPGQRFGPYEVLSAIGAGGIGFDNLIWPTCDTGLFTSLAGIAVSRPKQTQDSKSSFLGSAEENSERLVNRGRKIFHFDTFGDQAFGGQLHLHLALNTLTPLNAFGVANRDQCSERVVL